VRAGVPPLANGRWRVVKMGPHWRIIPPSAGMTVRSYWDHADAVRRAHELATEDRCVGCGECRYNGKEHGFGAEYGGCV
jgi:hypothetical protein